MNANDHHGRESKNRSWIRTSGMILGGLLTATLMIGLVSATKAQDQPLDQMGTSLVSGLKGTKGCLGVETADTGSGKSVIFAWFENREACLRWYYSDMHQAMMKMAFTDQVKKGHGKMRKPLSGVPESYEGPIMAVASLTFASGEEIEGINMPISQIAIELYMPLGGGLKVGGGFAPDSMEVSSTPGSEKAYR